MFHLYRLSALFLLILFSAAAPAKLNAQSAFWYRYHAPAMSAPVQIPAGDGVLQAFATLGFTGNDYRKLGLSMLSADGQVRWHRLIHYGGDLFPMTGMRAMNGDFLIAGYVTRSGIESEHNFVLRMDSAGNTRWLKTYYSVTNDRPADIMELSDSTIVVHGHGVINPGDEGMHVVIWLYSDGTLSKGIHYPAAKTPCRAIQIADDNMMIFGGGTVLTIAATGKTLNARHYAGLEEYSSGKPLLTRDGEYVFPLMGMNTNGILVKLDETGRLLQSGMHYANAQVRALTQNADGSLTGTGFLSMGDFAPDYRAAIFNFTPEGAWLSTRVLKDTAMMKYSYGLEINSFASGYLITGIVRQNGNEGYPAFISVPADTSGSACMVAGGMQWSPEPDMTFTNIQAGFEQMFYAPGVVWNNPVDYDLSFDTLCQGCGIPRVQLPADARLCSGNKIRLDAGPGRTRYTWSTGAKGRFLEVSEAGTYWVEVENSCGTASDTIQVDVASAIQPVISLSTGDVLPGDTFVISDGTPPSAAVQRTWRIDDSIFSSAAESIRYAFHKNGLHTIALELKDSFGCVYTQHVNVTINFHSLFIPNAFTPGTDGLNDVFAPKGYGLGSYRLQVFNRWGELVFEGENQGWNGRFRNAQSPDGVYHYFLHTQYDDGRREFRKGSVNLVR